MVGTVKRIAQPSRSGTKVNRADLLSCDAPKERVWGLSQFKTARWVGASFLDGVNTNVLDINFR